MQERGRNMTILKGGVIPRCENLPAEIEVAFNIVSSLIVKKLLTITQIRIGETPCYLWELSTAPIIELDGKDVNVTTKGE